MTRGMAFGGGERRTVRRTGRFVLPALALLMLTTAGGLAAAAPGAASSGKEATNPFTDNADAIKAGEKLFDAKCADCHGGDAMGQSGPDLTDDAWIYGGSDAAVFETIANGRKGGMPSWRSELSRDDIWKVMAYVRSLRKK